MLKSSMKSNMDKKIILWDIDGTLVKTLPLASGAHSQAVLEVFGPISFPIESSPGQTDLEVVLNILKRNGIHYDKNDICKVMIALDQISSIAFTTTTYEPCPFVEDALVFTRSRGWTNGILTGNSPFRGIEKIRSAGLIRLTEPALCFFGSQHETRNSLLEACVNSSLIQSATNVIVIGDTPLDIAAARNANLDVIAVATGKFTAEELNEFGANLVLQNLDIGFTEFKEFLKKVSDTA